MSITTTGPALGSAPDLMAVFSPDRLGRRPSPITMPGYRRGEPAPDRGRRRPPELLSADEIRRLIRATGRRSIGGARDRALIVVLWRCGLRISEALDLRVEDLDLEAGYLAVQHGKGDKRGIVAIDPQTVEILAQWLQVRGQVPGMPRHGFVFCVFSQPAPGGRMGAPQVRDRLKLLAARAGITKKVRPHGFRHTMATDMFREGVPLAVIEAQLRHEHPLTTQRYISRLLPTAELERVHQRPSFEI